MRFQFDQAFWSILDNHAPIDYLDSRGEREFVCRRRKMKQEVGRKRTSLRCTVVWHDFNFNVIKINVWHDIPVRNSFEGEVSWNGIAERKIKFIKKIPMDRPIRKFV